MERERKDETYPQRAIRDFTQSRIFAAGKYSLCLWEHAAAHTRIMENMCRWEVDIADVEEPVLNCSL
jgi:hypothetical protein